MRAARAALALVLTAPFAPATQAQETPAPERTPPVISTFSYTGELVANVAGGLDRGTTGLGMAGAEVTLRLRRLVRWPGASAFLFVLGTHGGSPSDLTGDAQGVSNIEAPATARLEEAWLQQNLLANMVSLLAGRYDLNTEFYRLDSGGLFLNSSLGIGPEFAQSGVAGPSIFPNTAVGVRIAVKPVAFAGLRLAVLDGVPVNRPERGNRLFAHGDGALVVSEVVLLSGPDTLEGPRQRRFGIGRRPNRSYVGKLALGGWHYTARFPDLDVTAPGVAPVRHRGSSGIYLIGDRRLWTAEPERPGALTAFVQLGAGDPRVNQIGGYVGGGITLSAPFASRADDRLGVAVASALMGSRFRRAEERAGSKTARAETTVELTHLHPLPWRRDVGTSYIGSSDEMVVKERYTQPRTAT